MKTRLINHASLQIIDIEESINIVCDPWYFGQVFNDSWQLKQQGHPGLARGIKLLLVSHEHPDHLSFATLRYLVKNNYTSPDCVLMFPSRQSNDVQIAVESSGIQCRYMPTNDPIKISSSYTIGFYGSTEDAGDYSICIKDNSSGVFLLNQNDQYTSPATATKIIQDFGKPTLLLTQFSLAGYYGNRRDPWVIRKTGTDFHLNRVAFYSQLFKPLAVIPFASFASFCDSTNFYLNDYAVTAVDLAKLKSIGIPLLFSPPGSSIPTTTKDIYHDLDSPDRFETFANFLERHSKIEVQRLPSVSTTEITLSLRERLASTFRFWGPKRFLYYGRYILMPRLSRNYRFHFNSLPPGSNYYSLAFKIHDFCLKLIQVVNSLIRPYRYFPICIVYLSDVPNGILLVSLIQPSCKFVHLPGFMLSLINALRLPDLIISSAHFAYMLKHKWGVDTANIVGGYEIFSPNAELLLHSLMCYPSND